MFDNVNMTLIKENISFAGNNAVFKGDNTIPELQCKGVTALCKILQGRQYAYLADEVGMGKTYQAIGVISMLLAEKKNAKILVIAPNEAVQRNWINEFRNFSRNNFVVAKEIEAEAVHPIELISNYVNEKKVTSVSVVRLTSFSTIVERVGKQGNPGYKYSNDFISAEDLFAGLEAITKQKIKKVGRGYNSHDAGKISGAILKNVTPKFDLVIVDEAQNIRNENNATAFFNYWLGLQRFKHNTNTDIGRNIDEVLRNGRNYRERRYLLLSATPAHRGVESLRRQLLYFEKEKNIPEIDHDYLEQFMIRRLRTYSGDSKYAVRNITADDVAKDLKMDQRMFLALIQSKLAQIQVSNNSTFKIGFLETFESYDVTTETEVRDEETGEKGKEFENGGSADKEEKGTALDKKMLQGIARSYGKTLNGQKCPPHPKLNFMEEEAEKIITANVCPSDIPVPDKAIVFVRRLASVDELVNRRLIRLYENKIISYWAERLAIEKKRPRLIDIQNVFKNLYKKTEDEVGEELDESEDEVDSGMDNEETKSLLLRWMAVKKSDKGNQYGAVSLFKKSMMRNKTNSYFFDENYYRTIHSELSEEQYKLLVEKLVDEEFIDEVSAYIAANYAHYIQGKDNKIKLNYSYLMALVSYLTLKREGHSLAPLLRDFFEIKDKGIASENIKRDQIVDIMLRTSLWNSVEAQSMKTMLSGEETYIVENFTKREALKSWTEKYLKSSEAILEFLYLYCSNENRSIEARAKLCKLAWEALYSDKCSHGKRIDKLFENVDLVINQLLGNEKITYKYDPAFLNMQQWVMPAVGGNKGNEALIKRFNTPFYPDIIVCTDVLKEGINLHLFCNRVYHYGLAWTPGDLEQRIGRVDRFFSKTHRERMAGKDTHVEVDYPYMGKSVDEHQLKKVLQFKLSADPLLDSAGINRKDINIDIDDTCTIDELIKYVPKSEEQTNFPYSGELFWKE